MKENQLVQQNNEVQNETNPIVSVDPQALIQAAIERNLDIDKMERLLAMRRELKNEAARDEYFKALASFQKECPIITKKKKVFVKNKLRYKYAPLEDIILEVRDFLEKHGFSYSIKTKQDKDSVTAICLSHHKFGHTEESEFRIPIITDAYMNVAQKVASALTYAKRYAFCDAFGIMTGAEDDDANFTGEPGQTYADEKKPVNEKKTGFDAAPERNQGVYRNIMALLQERENKKELFVLKEKIETKKKVDAIVMDLENLISFQENLNKQVAERRRAVKKNKKDC